MSHLYLLDEEKQLDHRMLDSNNNRKDYEFFEKGSLLHEFVMMKVAALHALLHIHHDQKLPHAD